MSHKAYLSEWETAMHYGLVNGRPFSQECIKSYRRYVTRFLEQYAEISFENLKQVLLTVPIEHLAKRLKIYESIRCFAKYLIDQESLPQDFLDRIRKIKPRRHLPPRKFTVVEADIQKLLAVSDTPLDTILVELLSQTGLRVTEATSLRLEDLDLEKGFLVVRQAKWGKTRKVGLTLHLQQAIRLYLTQRPQSDSPNFLLKETGEPIVRYGVTARLRKLGRRAQVHVSPHALRRAFVTINANKGRPLPMLQIACGHSDITTTRSYCMTTEDEAIEAMKQWS